MTEGPWALVLGAWSVLGPVVRPKSCGPWSDSPWSDSAWFDSPWFDSPRYVARNVPTRRDVGVYRFEDLRVWQAAKRQCDQVGGLLQRPEFRRDLKLSDQMNDAALSVMFNIAEGFLRRRDKEMLQFLRYAFASNGELKSGYYAAAGRNYLSQAEAAELIDGNESIARMLRRWQATLDQGESGRGRRTRTKNQGPGTDQGPKDGPGTKN